MLEFRVTTDECARQLKHTYLSLYPHLASHSWLHAPTKSIPYAFDRKVGHVQIDPSVLQTFPRPPPSVFPSTPGLYLSSVPLSLSLVHSILTFTSCVPWCPGHLFLHTHPLHPLPGGMLGKSAAVVGLSCGCCS